MISNHANIFWLKIYVDQGGRGKWIFNMNLSEVDPIFTLMQGSLRFNTVRSPVIGIRGMYGALQTTYMPAVYSFLWRMFSPSVYTYITNYTDIITVLDNDENYRY